MTPSDILQGLRYAANHRLTKGGGLALLVTGGLKAAAVAGCLIPGWAFTAGPILGYVVYTLLPAKQEAEIDAIAEKAVDVATAIPQVYSAPTDYPNSEPLPPVVTNLTTKDGTPVT